MRGDVRSIGQPRLDGLARGPDLGRKVGETGRRRLGFHRLAPAAPFLEFDDERGEGDEPVHLRGEAGLALVEIQLIREVIDEEDVVHPPFEGEGLEVERLDLLSPIGEELPKATIALGRVGDGPAAAEGDAVGGVALDDGRQFARFRPDEPRDILPGGGRGGCGRRGGKGGNGQDRSPRENAGSAESAASGSMRIHGVILRRTKCPETTSIRSSSKGTTPPVAPAPVAPGSSPRMKR